MLTGGRGRGGAGEERKGGGGSGESCESDRVEKGVHAGSRPGVGGLGSYHGCVSRRVVALAVPYAPLRTALNLPLPSSTLLGPQQMMMLEATHARRPQMAPTMPGRPMAKPTIEKMELAQTYVGAQ